MSDLHELSAVALVAAVRSRQLSATEVTEQALARAGTDHVGAFVTITADLALAQAADVDRRLTQGESLPLAGLPCPIKDLVSVRSVPYRAGSAALADQVGSYDDAIVTRLRAAGTIMLGKTATPEFGLPCYTEPDGQAPARTPYDLRRSAGGSSGGAAAAVAAKLVPVAHASDGGGSIRIPASACGLVGHKPSRGLISAVPSRTAGVGLATDGVLTRTVRDTAFLLDVLRGNSDGDTYFAPDQSLLAALNRPIRRLRIGLLTRPVIIDSAGVDPVCVAAAQAAAHRLADLGHEVIEAPVPFPAERWAAFADLWSVMAASVPVLDESLLRPLTRWLRVAGRQVSGEAHAAAVEAVQKLTVEVAQNWAGLDVIVSPTLARPPAFIGELRNDENPAADFRAQSEFTPWTSVYNLTGRPAISVPFSWAEVDSVRLPIGVMLGGRVGRDAELLALAAALME